jgi:hypothetical protein
MQLAFSRHTLIRFVRAFYAVFVLATRLGKLFYDLVGAPGQVPTDGRPEADNIPDFELINGRRSLFSLARR